MDDKNVELLYKAASSKYGDAGDIKSFKNKLQNADNRKMLYERMKSDGFSDLGDYEAFSSKLGFSEQKGNVTDFETGKPYGTPYESSYKGDPLIDSFLNATNPLDLNLQKEESKLGEVTFNNEKEKLPDTFLPEHLQEPKDYEQRVFDKTKPAVAGNITPSGNTSFSEAAETAWNRQRDDLKELQDFKNQSPEKQEEISRKQIDALVQRLDTAEAENKRKRDELVKGTSFMQAIKNNFTNPNGMYGDEYRELDSERLILEKARNAIKAYKDSNSSGTIMQFLNELGRNSPEMLKDIATFGILPAVESLQLYKIASKAQENGLESLSESERRTMDALSMNQSIQGYASQFQTTSQEVANGIAQSIPFMTAFTGFGAIAKGATKGLGRVTTRAVKGITGRMAVSAAENIGAQAAKTTAQKAGALALNVLDAAGRSAIVAGIDPHMYKKAIDNMAGEAGYTVSPLGKIEYTGQEGDMTFGKAFGNAFTIQFIENFSEFSGFGIELGEKWLKKQVPAKMGEFFSKYSNSSKLLNRINKLSRSMGWNGTINEWIEEQVGTVLHALTDDGQGQWDDLIDPHQQWVTFLSVASVGSGISAANTVGNSIAKRRVRKDYESTKSYFDGYFSENANIRDAVNKALSGSIEEQNEFISEFVKSAKSFFEVL